jgi:hypothetical protein
LGVFVDRISERMLAEKWIRERFARPRSRASADSTVHMPRDERYTLCGARIYAWCARDAGLLCQHCEHRAYLRGVDVPSDARLYPAPASSRLAIERARAQYPQIRLARG